MLDVVQSKVCIAHDRIQGGLLVTIAKLVWLLSAMGFDASLYLRQPHLVRWFRSRLLMFYILGSIVLYIYIHILYSIHIIYM